MSDDRPIEKRGFVSSACLVLGWGVIGYALYEMVAQQNATNPPQLFSLLIGLNLVNDLVVIPATIALAVIARRVCPGWLLGSVQLGLIVSGAVLLYAAPLVGGFGHTALAGPSRLPWDYVQNLAVVLGIVWGVCGLAALWAWRRTRSA